jgi:hypothetical protein
VKQRDCDHITPDDPALVVDQRGPRDATAKFGDGNSSTGPSLGGVATAAAPNG